MGISEIMKEMGISTRAGAHLLQPGDFIRGAAHNPKVVGSNPAPATNQRQGVADKLQPLFLWFQGNLPQPSTSF
jgi:hypothetical protein